MNLAPYIRAQYSILSLVTPEESRAEAAVLQMLKELNGSNGKVKRNLIVWSHTEGFMDLGNPKNNEQQEDPIEALVKLKNDMKSSPPTVYVFRDFHAFFDNAKVIRLLRDIARDFKQHQKNLILLSPIAKLPPDLERDVTVIEFELPKRGEVEVIFDALYEGAKKSLGKITADERERIVQAAMGLTTVEAENALSKAFVEFSSAEEKSREPISKVVLREKAIAVKKTGILEYFPCSTNSSDIGGLENLKEWLLMRAKAFSSRAREFRLPMPRGCLLVGLPGCGKSLSAKAASNIFGVPLLKFDIGRVFAGLVGESERNMRLAIQTAEAIGNSVLWLDEMEKGFSGLGNGSTDGGTSQRVFGHFLTWMQEKTAPCFVVSTVNRIDCLPPELLRKGRFDEIFFVGCPTPGERAQILRIHLSKYGRKAENFEKDIPAMVEVSDMFSGAELEEAVVSALYTAFHHNRELQGSDIIRALKQTNPLAKSRADELGAMVKWAETNAVNASRVDKSDNTVKVGSTTAGRQLDL